jgi:hypothetical protein
VFFDIIPFRTEECNGFAIKWEVSREAAKNPVFMLSRRVDPYVTIKIENQKEGGTGWCGSVNPNEKMPLLRRAL